LNVKLKEKDQEVKLNELKIRELKKSVPNTRLKPLKDKRRTVDHGSYQVSLKEKSRYDPMELQTLASKKRLNPLHNSLPNSS
jgi:hypothetical protein